jgi:acetoin:2,6-dichlorophenolindophenol oxidoreductase subunit alpha
MAISVVAPPDSVLCRLHERMVLIRAVEERLRAEYPSRNIRGPIHLSIGQEGVAAGVLVAARPSDVCVSTHRNHAHYLAKGGDLSGMVDELYGLETGCSRGAAGSMHLFDAAAGLWGASAIVGGSVPVAVGLAFAKKLDGNGDVALAFTGDGGTDEGSFYEALNLAALLEVPLLIVVEQNDLSTNSPLRSRQAKTDLIAKAAAFGVRGERVDGQDAVAVHATADRMLDQIRGDKRPRLLEAVTSRLCAHVGPTVSVDSPIGPYTDWSDRVANDPLGRFRAWSTKNRPALGRTLETIEGEVLARVESAFVQAKAGFAAKNAILQLAAPPPPNPNRV